MCFSRMFIVNVFLFYFKIIFHNSLEFKVCFCFFNTAFISAAMQQVLDNLTELPSSTGAEEIDLIFLKGIMENPIVKSLAKVY